VSGCSILSPVLDACTPLKAFPFGKCGQNWPSGFAILRNFSKKLQKEIMLVECFSNYKTIAVGFGVSANHLAA
jgi:hypothetical protein